MNKAAETVNDNQQRILAVDNDNKTHYCFINPIATKNNNNHFARHTQPAAQNKCLIDFGEADKLENKKNQDNELFSQLPFDNNTNNISTFNNNLNINQHQQQHIHDNFNYNQQQANKNFSINYEEQNNQIPSNNNNLNNKNFGFNPLDILNAKNQQVLNQTGNPNGMNYNNNYSFDSSANPLANIYDNNSNNNKINSVGSSNMNENEPINIISNINNNVNNNQVQQLQQQNPFKVLKFLLISTEIKEKSYINFNTYYKLNL